METPDHILRQRIVGGNVALDLLNTQNGPAGEPPEEDALRDYGDLVAWGRHVGLLGESEAEALVRRARRHPQAARTTFERAIATRAYLYQLFKAVADGQHPPDAAVEALQRDETEALAHGALVPVDGRFSWRWTRDDDLGRPLWPVVHAAVELLSNGPLDRIKGCAACRFHFLDESKNRSRRWCSMEDCGTAAKMKKYVARRASARSRRQAARG
jgi:predicted RNA-binding Zn ribbon-like protein